MADCDNGRLHKVASTSNRFATTQNLQTSSELVGHVTAEYFAALLLDVLNAVHESLLRSLGVKGTAQNT